MMKTNISKIVIKYLSGRFSHQTEEKVQRWLVKDDNRVEKESASLKYWNSLDVGPNSKTYQALAKVNKRIKTSSKHFGRIPLKRRISQVAAILIPLLVVAGAYLYFTRTSDDLMEIRVAYGEEKHLVLPDNSEIWINSGSTVQYPKEFTGNKRTVYLKGEAYFSVQKNPSKPFVVETSKLSIKVLGTKFNVKAYPNDIRTIASLTSGKIELSTATNQSRILIPNQQLCYNHETSSIDIKTISADETQGWINGNLIFADASFDEILRVLERHFNVAIESQVPQTKELYTVKFLKQESLDDIFDVLSDMTGDFSIDKQESKIILKPEV